MMKRKVGSGESEPTSDFAGHEQQHEPFRQGPGGHLEERSDDVRATVDYFSIYHNTKSQDIEIIDAHSEPLMASNQPTSISLGIVKYY